MEMKDKSTSDTFVDLEEDLHRSRDRRVLSIELLEGWAALAQNGLNPGTGWTRHSYDGLWRMIVTKSADRCNASRLRFRMPAELVSYLLTYAMSDGVECLLS